MFDYYKGLVALRKDHPAFRMPSAQMIREHLKFIETGDPGIIAYQISGSANGDKWKNILVVFNGNTTDKKITIPAGNWKLAVDGNSIDQNGINNVTPGEMPLSAASAYVLYEQ